MSWIWRFFYILFCVQPKMTKHTDNNFLNNNPSCIWLKFWLTPTAEFCASPEDNITAFAVLELWILVTGSYQGHTHQDHEVHARPPTNANQTESWAGQSIYIFHCHQKSPQAMPSPSKGLHTASMPADRAQANQGVGKVPKPILASLWLSMRHCCQKCEKTNWENTVKNGQ